MTGMATGDADRRIRYYACRASWNHDVANRLVRAESLEEEFVAILRRLKATPEAAERYRRKSAATSPRLLERSLAEANKQLAEVERKRAAVWELHVAGKVRADDVQEQLDTVAGQRDEIRLRIAGIQEQLALSKSDAARDKDAHALMQRAADTFAKADEAEKRQIARAVSLAVGGLCVEADGRLSIRSTTDPAPQRKASR